MSKTELELRKAVKERYSNLAEGGSSCCESTCCGGDYARFGIPQEASSINAGCGSPLQLVSSKEGNVVLDLGSGGGIDVFRASKVVGETGRAVGVDATPEMIWRARETAQKYDYKNVEFRLGEIEHLPIEPNSVDYVISNCVVNLAPDKWPVFKEAYRILKPGGIFAVADVTAEREIPESLRNNLRAWSECISGAISTSEYRRLLGESGFVEIQVKPASMDCDCECCHNGKYPFGIASSHIKAKKPGPK
jgi:SAM-dependent methyltransferase